jgi:GT2 family glycosyltransferase/glycosyltransferase involved in cell wall biosynthesis
VNILFVNYGDFTTNSLNHIGGFAGWLTPQGHSCLVAVPHGLDTLDAIAAPRFTAVEYGQYLRGEVRFPDGRPADVLHAWTPREGIRRFVLAHQRLSPTTRVVIHLEDNEEHLTAAFARRPWSELAGLTDDELAALLPEGVSHPRRSRQLLALADAATVIVPRLGEFVPAGVPVQELPPGVDFSLYQPQAPDEALRHSLGLARHEKVIVYTGSTTFANAPAQRELLRAVHLLNEQGHAVRLLRTGFHPEEFVRDCGFDWRRFTLDAGFVPKARLPALLALADVLVQPGQPGAFDDYRLPSKLPEFLAAGRPVIAPATNIGRQLRDGVDALLLQRGDATEIAALATRILTDPALARTLAEHATAFARRHFAPDQVGANLLAAYVTATAAPSRAAWQRLPEGASESVLLADLLRAQLASPDAAVRAAALAQFDLLTASLGAAESAARRGLGAELRTKLEDEIARLQQQRDLTRSHVANLEQTLAGTKEAFAAFQRSAGEQIAAQQQRIAQLEGIIATLQRQLYNFQAELVRATAAAEDQAAQLAARVADRERKVRHMQESFSWQATAPLRALRRQFLDRAPAAAPSAPAPASPPAATTPDAKLSVDEPIFWHHAAGPLVIRGWCVLPDGTTPDEVRATIGERVFRGRAGLKREDVAAVHGPALAASCGFEIDTILEAGRFPVLVEARRGGSWHPLVQRELVVFSPARPPEIESYQKWLHLYEAVTPSALRALREEVARLAAPPLISVVMPVYNTPEIWLRRAVASVQAQVYERWELCIADDASTAPHVRRVLQELAAADPRIRLVLRERNGHISAASNSALEIARGEFCALLDHDDELSPRALARVALEAARRPDAHFFYSDEDKIDERGERFDPYLKPDFLPDLLLGQNCLSHLSVIRTEKMRAVGGFRVGLEGSQDWDLALRLVRTLRVSEVVHIPEVLYHWRAIAGSTARAVGEKNYTVTAAERALRDHFAALGTSVELRPVPGDHWRVVRPVPSPAPLVSLLIPTRDRLALTRTCVESILAKTTYPAFEIVVIDNESVEPATLEWFAAVTARDARVRVVRYAAPFNYSAINNFAVTLARGSIVGLLNNDLEVINPDWLDEMVAHAVRPEIGCVGAKLLYPDGTLQHAGIILGLGGVANHAFYRQPGHTDGYKNRARLAQNYSAVTGACLLVRKAIYEQVGGLNERELAVAFNDVDFCLKVRAAGFLNLWTPFAELYHHESASRGTEDTPEKQARFAREVDYMRRTWARELDSDPAYNRNFSLEIEGFKFACPPRGN